MLIKTVLRPDSRESVRDVTETHTIHAKCTCMYKKCTQQREALL